MPLTDITIRHAQAGRKSRKMFDSRGLYLEVTPRGSKYWRLKYRFGGREKRLSLGVYPDVSLKEARQRCEDARRLLSREIDPSEHRQAMKAARAQQASNSFEAVAREWFTKHSPNWAHSHSSVMSYLNCRLYRRRLLPDERGESHAENPIQGDVGGAGEANAERDHNPWSA